MTEKSIFSILICIVLIFSLEYHVIANEEGYDRGSQLEVLECYELLRTYEDLKGKEFLIDAENGMTPESICTINGDSSFNIEKRICSEIAHDSEISEEGEKLQERSPDVIMTTLIFTQGIHINQDQIIEVWSQNISSQPRNLDLSKVSLTCNKRNYILQQSNLRKSYFF